MDLLEYLFGGNAGRKEIRIIDGEESSSYFHIMPAKILDINNITDPENYYDEREDMISIEEDDVDQYLTPFLYKYFDEESPENKYRISSYGYDDDGVIHVTYAEGFEWYLENNFFTFDQMEKILKDISDTIDALLSGKENEVTTELKVKRGLGAGNVLYVRGMTDEEVRKLNANRPREDDTEVAVVVDFYRRFICRMENMMRVGKEKGYNLITFVGP